MPYPTPRQVLDDVLCHEVERVLDAALESEVADFLGEHAHLRDGRGRARIVRNGYLPERFISIGKLRVPVRIPRVRDREPHAPDTPRFASRIVPVYQRGVSVPHDRVPWLVLGGLMGAGHAPLVDAIAGHPVSARLRPGWDARCLGATSAASAFLNVNGSRRTPELWITSWPQPDDPGSAPDPGILVVLGRAPARIEILAARCGDPREASAWAGLLTDLCRHGLVIPRTVFVCESSVTAWLAIERTSDPLHLKEAPTPIAGP